MPIENKYWNTMLIHTLNTNNLIVEKYLNTLNQGYDEFKDSLEKYQLGPVMTQHLEILAKLSRPVAIRITQRLVNYNNQWMAALAPEYYQEWKKLDHSSLHHEMIHNLQHLIAEDMILRKKLRYNLKHFNYHQGTKYLHSRKARSYLHNAFEMENFIIKKSNEES